MENGINATYLFEENLVRDINWDLRKADFKNGVSPEDPGNNLKLRPLHIGDYEKGFLDLLSELTTIGQVSQEQFTERFVEMRRCAGTYFVVVIEDISKSQIIGSATLVMEQKFIHSSSQRGRIEDVVVSNEYRGKQLGKLLVQALTLLGKDLGCYKMSLECTEKNSKFYETFGYEKDGQHFMVQRFKE